MILRYHYCLWVKGYFELDQGYSSYSCDRQIQFFQLFLKAIYLYNNAEMYIHVFM